MLIPLASLSAAAHRVTPYRLQALLAALFAVGLVTTHVLFVSVAFYRYLHPLPFFVLLNGAPLACLPAGATASCSWCRSGRSPVTSRNQIASPVKTARSRQSG